MLVSLKLDTDCEEDLRILQDMLSNITRDSKPELSTDKEEKTFKSDWREAIKCSEKEDELSDKNDIADGKDTKTSGFDNVEERIEEPVSEKTNSFISAMTRDEIRDAMPDVKDKLHGYFFKQLQKSAYGFENVLIEHEIKASRGRIRYDDPAFEIKIRRALSFFYQRSKRA